MNGKQLLIAVVAAVFFGSLFGYQVATANPPQAPNKCPDGGEWTKHDSGSLTDTGADEYCVKGGSLNNEGQGCNAYLEFGSYSDVLSVVNAEGACGLSHWSEKNEVDPTSTNVPEPTPTNTPEDPSPTPTPTDDPCTEECEPTPTDEPPGPTATSEPPDNDDDKPERLPNTGALPTTVDPFTWAPDVWREDGLPENLLLTHNGAKTGFGSKVVQLQRGDVFGHPSLGSSDYEVVGVLRVAAEDVWVLDTVQNFDGLVLMTCSGYNTQTQIWRFRVFVFLQEVE